MKTITKALLSFFATLCLVLTPAALALAPASASPLCEVGRVCGNIVVSTASRGGCSILIDGNWADGSKGWHPTIANKAGYSRFSAKYFKDTDGFRISSNCKGKTTRGSKIYYGGNWYKIKDYQLGTIKLWYK